MVDKWELHCTFIEVLFDTGVKASVKEKEAFPGAYEALYPVLL
jgi:hypothetical protein